ncbi:hypothetical protein TRP8649_00831 [Pelagimonas phthalicica]|uniref:Uncharacterized protein n=1 Tax=Pelagimonas phthalicica TaxID=1037362 RepID=A0A238JA48_9RHOB|nr:hypothetical protein CLV87_1240 [Pelagimonas phthalicica]SMX26746.1 hypothetical protein TRP8649_00831 [Pelagimonas phthalicica]
MYFSMPFGFTGFCPSLRYMPLKENHYSCGHMPGLEQNLAN